MYHVFQVPVRIAFNPFPDFVNYLALVSDGPMDILLFLHVVVHLNTAYKSSRKLILQIRSMICTGVLLSDQVTLCCTFILGANWISSRYKIFRHGDFLFLIAAIPLDWSVLCLHTDIHLPAVSIFPNSDYCQKCCQVWICLRLVN